MNPSDDNPPVRITVAVREYFSRGMIRCLAAILICWATISSGYAEEAFQVEGKFYFLTRKGETNRPGDFSVSALPPKWKIRICWNGVGTCDTIGCDGQGIYSISEVKTKIAGGPTSQRTISFEKPELIGGLSYGVVPKRGRLETRVLWFAFLQAVVSSNDVFLPFPVDGCLTASDHKINMTRFTASPFVPDNAVFYHPPVLCQLANNTWVPVPLKETNFIKIGSFVAEDFNSYGNFRLPKHFNFEFLMLPGRPDRLNMVTNKYSAHINFTVTNVIREALATYVPPPPADVIQVSDTRFVETGSKGPVLSYKMTNAAAWRSDNDPELVLRAQALISQKHHIDSIVDRGKTVRRMWFYACLFISLVGPVAVYLWLNRKRAMK